MRNRDSLHSDNEIKFCVQLQARYDLQTAADQQGEQSLNKDAITVGGVRWFFADNDAVTKWTMGRAKQAQNFNFFLQMCNIREQYNKYKSTCLLQILKSESGKGNVVTVLENEYVNPFDIAIDRTMLINFSSGSEMEIPTKLLHLQQVGITVAKEFLLEQLILSSKKFFHPIPGNINSQPLWWKSISQKTQPDHG